MLKIAKLLIMVVLLAGCISSFEVLPSAKITMSKMTQVILSIRRTKDKR